MAKVTLDEIKTAHRCIEPHVLRTPLVHAETLSEQLGHQVWLKLEQLQPTGSFKFRGATNAVLSLDDQQRARGVITASSGNHGPALARAASRLGVRSVICLSHLVPENKVANVRRQGGEPHIAGHDFDQSLIECRRLMAEQQLGLIHAFDDPRIVAGAGTAGLEIMDQIDEITCVLVPLSGGGLLAGVAAAIKARAPQIRVIGVTMENGASMYQSIQAGAPVNVEEVETIADALGGNIGLHNKWTFEAVRDHVDDCVLVSDEQIRGAIALLFDAQGLVVEGAGAVGVAALMSGGVRCSGRAACLITGRNISTKQFLNVVRAK
ncbi:MAG: threonine/serine dehydratase [Rhodobacteraceae bacterium]|nr:threonine/serine dehydratase [Paracoccaceae bacterium]